MAPLHKRHLLFLLLLLSNPSALPISSLEEQPASPPLPSDRQEIQLRKLQSLVENLTLAVSALQSSLSSLRGPSPSPPSSSFASPDRPAGPPSSPSPERNDRFETRVRPLFGGRGGITVTKYKPSWSERFQFLSAVRLDSDATCVHILPYRDFDGLAKYVAVGDSRGRVFVFLSTGDALVEFDTLSPSPVTAMLSYISIWKNESFLLTGHEDGAVLAHHLSEAANGEDWSALSVSTLRSFERRGEERFPVALLEAHQVGRTRYIMSSDAGGKIRVYRENGTIYGIAAPLSRPLAFLKQRLLFLTENGVGSLDLRSMTVRESECEGLNGSVAKKYVFDASERSKAYGFTSSGDIVHVVLLGDMGNFKCMVRAKRKSEMDDLLGIQTVKGYLVIISHEKVFVYNVSSPSYNIRLGGPRPLFHATLDEIKLSFLNSPAGLESSINKPLISTDSEKLVVLGLGSGYVGIYRSNLPVFKAEFNSVLWSSPVVLCVLFLIGAWHFFGRKREPVFASWNPDDPFSVTSVTTGLSLGSGSGERAYADSTRDMRGSALMGPSRRYSSPSRYPGGTGTSFRPGFADPSFRTTAELKYRGQNLDIAGFPKRRDPLFSNNQVVEDHAS